VQSSTIATVSQPLSSSISSFGYNFALRFIPFDLPVANHQVRSALVVPPDFGGLLHFTRGRLVSSCNRSWGSLCFKDHYQYA